jgi:ligand-binding sensor domain-containing protein
MKQNSNTLFRQEWSFIIAFILFYSCSQNKEPLQKAAMKSDALVAPKVTVLAGLPDGGKPKVYYLDKTPKPLIILNPKTSVTHSFIDPITHNVIAPEAQGVGFFTNYNTEQGLALSSVSCGHCDKEGNLWFGTLGGGVSRYDGKSFTNFTADQGLGNNSIISITEDKSGNLWFATGGGVSRYDGKSFTNFTTKEGLVSNFVTGISEDKAGNLWFGTNGGVSRYDGKSLVNFTTAQGLANNSILSIAEDKAGNLWFGTDGGGVLRYDGKSFTSFTTKEWLVSNIVKGIAEDKARNLWFGTNGGVSRYDGKSFVNFTAKDGLANNNVLGIAEADAGNLWFATAGGATHYNGKSFVSFTTAQGLASNEVNNIVLDKSGNLWFGTNGGGVSRYDGKSIVSFTTAQGLVNNSVQSIKEDKEGNLWFGTDGGGVLRYDGKSFTSLNTASWLQNNSVVGIITEDKGGNLWFGGGNTGGGAARYDGKSFVIFTTAQGLANNNVQSITEDKAGNLWFCTFGGGISRFDGKSFTNFTTAQGLADNNVSGGAMVDKAGNLWFGSRIGGVSRYDGKSFTNYGAAQGLPKNPIYDVNEDKAGNLWFGSFGGGVSRFDGKTFLNFTRMDGVADNTVYCVITDRLGNIIVGTNLGFTVLKGFTASSNGGEAASIEPSNNLSNEALKKYKPIFEIYNQNSGYPVKDLNNYFGGNGAMVCDSKGIIWGGTADKLVRFDYSALKKSKVAPSVFIQSVKVDNEGISWYSLASNAGKEDSLAIINEEVTVFGSVLRDEARKEMRHKFRDVKFDSITKWYPVPQNLILPHDRNNITFEFGAREFARGNLVKYQYILEGSDKDWSPISNNTSANFDNIFEGTYTFKLKAQSPDGVWSEPIAYTFKVLPPWWRTWWMYTIYATLVIGLIILLVWWNSRRLIAQKKILEHKVSVATKQIREEKAKAEDALTELKSTQAQLIQSEKMASLGELTAGIAHEIQNPLNFVNNFSDVNKELIEELKEERNKEQGTRNEDRQKEIIRDLEVNEEKINYHGKRADSIVKGMLQHSRVSSGQKELTDINKLADEYLRLAYHGLQAKDKNFIAEIKTDFDPLIGKINIVPQNIGRVILNLISNAFYAVHEKAKQNIPGYAPTVIVKTKKIADKVLISVADNGKGIPKNITDKIFQPFFTTKPAGQGTGLGLSLAYDIIKAHGGDIKVETKEGEGSVFVIQLPVG